MLTTKLQFKEYDDDEFKKLCTKRKTTYNPSPWKIHHQAFKKEFAFVATNAFRVLSVRLIFIKPSSSLYDCEKNRQIVIPPLRAHVLFHDFQVFIVEFQLKRLYLT